MYREMKPHKLSDGTLVYSSERQAEHILKLDGKTIKERLMVYLEKIPRKIPQGWVLQHNHVAPRLHLGTNGFSPWLSNRGRKICQCEWCQKRVIHRYDS
jgi:hypothetical protein